MDYYLFLALGQADERDLGAATVVAGLDGGVKLALAAIYQYQVGQAPGLAVLIAQPAAERLIHVVEVVVVVELGLELAVFGLVADTIGKDHHAGYHVGTLLVADV